MSYEAWHSVCEALKESGAITSEDLKSYIPALDTLTPGQRLVRIIWEWGKGLK